MREDLDFFLTMVKLVPYVYRANIVLTFSFPEKIWLLPFLLSRFHSIVPRKNLFVLVSTFSFPEKIWLLSFLLSHFYIIVPSKNLFVLVFTFSFRKEICLFLFPEKFIPSPVTRKSRPMYSSTMVDEACVIFLSFSGGWKRSIFFICR